VSRFDDAIAAAAEATAEARLRRGAGQLGLPRLPRSFTAEGVLGLDRYDRLVPALEAAVAMDVPLAEIVSLAESGLLDAQVRRDGLWVRPVVLSKLRVRDPRVPSVDDESEHVADNRAGTDAAPWSLPEFGAVER
jgi:hypothetical protein